jgi:H+/Cl- antiporter ClcA
LICAGASAGVSCAFGAPIGGALFLYELSRGNPVWTFNLLWKTFFTCCTAVFTMGFFDNTLHGEKVDWSESALKFAKTQPDQRLPTSILLGALIIGTISGILGALFININFRINGFRGKHQNKNWKKILEACLFAFASASAFYWAPYIFSTCLPNEQPALGRDFKDKVLSIWDKSEDYDISRGWCKEGTYNPLATLMWKTEAGVIRQMMDADVLATRTQMFAFAGVWYFFFVTTYGIFLPSGLFLPGMIIGCAIGDLYTHFCIGVGLMNADEKNNYRVTFIILAMCSMLAGYTRMTYSIIVVTLETSQSISIFLPIVIACGTSNIVGDFFNRSLYERAVRGK